MANSSISPDGSLKSMALPSVAPPYLLAFVAPWSRIGFPPLPTFVQPSSSPPLVDTCSRGASVLLFFFSVSLFPSVSFFPLSLAGASPLCLGREFNGPKGSYCGTVGWIWNGFGPLGSPHGEPYRPPYSRKSPVHDFENPGHSLGLPALAPPPFKLVLSPPLINIHVLVSIAPLLAVSHFWNLALVLPCLAC